MNEQQYRAAGEPFFFVGNEVGVLLSHGYTGTTSSMRHLGEYLHANENWTVLAPRLAGHGDTPAAMAKTGAVDWIGSLEEALDTLAQRCSTIFMAGLSMGGCLTLYMAARHPGRIRAIVPINAVLALGGPGIARLAFAREAPEFVQGVGNDVKDPAVTEVAYREVPSATFRELYALMGVTRDLLGEIHCPTLVMVSPEDHVVPPWNAKIILGGIAAADRRQLLLSNSYHVATMDFDKDLIARATRSFFKEQLARA